MVMDEIEESKGDEESEGAPAEPSQPSPAEEEERGARVDAAKAFFRAMYAGEEPPASFGQSEEKADTSTQTACRKCEGLEFAIRESEQKTAEAETLYKRMAADFDNYRRRMEREREESVALGVKKAAEAMMPALDDLDRAMLYLNLETPADKLFESFNLVTNRILHSLDQVGLKPIIAVGEQFDPKYHEPVQQIETTEHPDGTVMNELRRGYMLHDKVVRPALVNVASNSAGVVTSAVGASEAEPELTIVESEVQSEEEPIISASPEDGTRVYDLGDIADA